MKTYRLLSLIAFTLLTSCATLSPTAMDSNQLNQKLNDNAMHKFTTTLANAQDHATTQWDNAKGNKHYRLITDKIYVNNQGQPCRSYQLAVKENYDRPWFSQGTACRNNQGLWQTIKDQ